MLFQGKKKNKKNKTKKKKKQNKKKKKKQNFVLVAWMVKQNIRNENRDFQIQITNGMFIYLMFSVELFID